MILRLSAIALAIGLCIPLGVRGQTDAELQAQLLAKAAEMRDICRQLTDGAPGSRCYILTEFTDKECPAAPDALAESRLNVEQAVANVTETQEAILSMRTWFNNLSTTQLEQARQALDQVLQDNPTP